MCHVYTNFSRKTVSASRCPGDIASFASTDITGDELTGMQTSLSSDREKSHVGVVVSSTNPSTESTSSSINTLATKATISSVTSFPTTGSTSSSTCLTTTSGIHSNTLKLPATVKIEEVTLKNVATAPADRLKQWMHMGV